MPGPTTETPFDPQKFVEDVKQGSAALDAPFDAGVTEGVLTRFERECRDGVIQFRIASVDRSPVNYRVGCLFDVDWVARAEEAGVVPARVPDERLLRFLPEVKRRFPESAYLGADFDAANGFEKIYLVFFHPVPFRAFLEVESLPDDLRAKAERLERHGFKDVVICAADYVKGSINVYFVWKQTTPAWLDGFAAEWGHGPISGSTKEEILRSTPIHGSVATTWSYARGGPQRWCVYAIALRYDRPELYAPGHELADFVLPERHPRFARFDGVVGTQTDAVAYGLGWSFGEPFEYLKYERSYTKDLLSHYKTQTDAVEQQS